MVDSKGSLGGVFMAADVLEISTTPKKLCRAPLCIESKDCAKIAKITAILVQFGWQQVRTA